MNMHNFDVEFALRSIRRSEEAIKSDSMVIYANKRKAMDECEKNTLNKGNKTDG